MNDDPELKLAIGNLLNISNVVLEDHNRVSLGQGFADAVAGGDGLVLHRGAAETRSGIRNFKLLEKICRVLPMGKEPGSWLYWKREALAYQSGLLDNLSPKLRAPTCYGVAFTDQPSARIFMEALSDPQPEWADEHHALAAQAIGHLNGVSALPDINKYTWMAPGRSLSWTDLVADLVEDFESLMENKFMAQWLSGSNFQRTNDLWTKLDILKDAIAKLPKCFCHHDAFKRNMMFINKPDGDQELVLIDWAFAGYGVLGEELSAMVGATLTFKEVDTSDAHRFSELVFENYMIGLRDSGWTGDDNDIRIGFAATTAMMFGLGALGAFYSVLQQNDYEKIFTQAIGVDVNNFFDNLSEIHPLFLDLGDEAIAQSNR